MGFNSEYKRRGKKVEVTIHEEDWRKLATFKWDEGDKKTKNRCLITIKEKYGISMKPSVDADMEWMQ